MERAPLPALQERIFCKVPSLPARLTRVAFFKTNTPAEIKWNSYQEIGRTAV
ncbi:hypothetical protein WN55_09617 [Dufourea novaeangliae]|uniref:Uncharacterized protein n=1 Tax=Dufourea novaeangliae TaxID=178035 RepID=A0A154P0P4_DUFNO|nr:hypothetical protein WN55_09617 [Dufourea novaeangliae]